MCVPLYCVFKCNSLSVYLSTVFKHNSLSLYLCTVFLNVAVFLCASVLFFCVASLHVSLTDMKSDCSCGSCLACWFYKSPYFDKSPCVIARHKEWLQLWQLPCLLILVFLQVSMCHWQARRATGAAAHAGGAPAGGGVCGYQLHRDLYPFSHAAWREAGAKWKVQVGLKTYKRFHLCASFECCVNICVREVHFGFWLELPGAQRPHPPPSQQRQTVWRAT